MKEFKIKEDSYTEIRKQILVKVIPLILSALIFAFVFVEMQSNTSNETKITTYSLLLPLLIGALAIGIKKGIKRQKEIFNSYRLIVDNNGITREQSNTSSVRILYSEITKISKNNKGVLVITGSSSLNPIIVPAKLEELTTFESILTEKCSVRIGMSKPLIQLLLIPLQFTVGGLVAVIYISTNKLVVAICGTILAVILIWTFINIRVSKNMDKKIKQITYSVFFLIIWIIGIIVVKLLYFE